ncbi:hypothetical protein ABZP36_021826 [Zizania latifolia]
MQRPTSGSVAAVFVVVVVLSPAMAMARAGAAGKKNATTARGKSAPALIVFGDSIVDPGNNNGINTIIKADFPPYGHDFGQSHRPTGRFCNGRIPTDFIASRLGIKELLPAYLSPDLETQDLLTGVSFASGGTGFDPLTPTLASVISMTDQLSMFEQYKERVRAAAGDARVAEMLNKGIFAICAGSDDVANTYFTMRARPHYDHASYAALLVHHAAAFVEDLIQAGGARRVAFIGMPPIGCVPSQRTMSGGSERGCSAGHNEIAVAYNAGLSRRMEELGRRYPGTRLVFMDIYGFLMDMMMRPHAYGFAESTMGCCGTGLLEVSVLCNGVTSAVCDPVSDYLFWDSYHPTEKAYKILADFVYDKYIKELLD